MKKYSHDHATTQAKQYSFTIAPAALAPLPCVSWRRCNAVGGAATDAGGKSQVSAAKQCQQACTFPTDLSTSVLMSAPA